jgi:glypican 4 (K-glypican)
MPAAGGRGAERSPSDRRHPCPGPHHPSLSGATTNRRPAGGQLRTCPTDTSCCTRAAEQRLEAWAERQYRQQLLNRTNIVALELDTRASQVDDYIYVLLNKAQREFHEMFTRTYGVMYQKNADVFQEYFQDLKIYYDKGNLNPADSTASFFTTLYQKMFKVLCLIKAVVTMI